MEKKRSIGVTISGVLLILSPLKLIVITLIFYMVNSLPLKGLPNTVFMGYKSNIFYILFTLVSIILGVGILKLKEWARISMIYLSSFFVVVMLASFFYKTTEGIIPRTLSLIEYGLYYWFFCRPTVKAQFK